jgi:hypothetical protein
MLCTVALTAALVWVVVAIFAGVCNSPLRAHWLAHWVTPALLLRLWVVNTWATLLSLAVLTPFAFLLYEAEGWSRARSFSGRAVEAVLALALLLVAVVAAVSLGRSLLYAVIRTVQAHVSAFSSGLDFVFSRRRSADGCVDGVCARAGGEQASSLLEILLSDNGGAAAIAALLMDEVILLPGLVVCLVCVHDGFRRLLAAIAKLRVPWAHRDNLRQKLEVLRMQMDHVAAEIVSRGGRVDGRSALASHSAATSPSSPLRKRGAHAPPPAAPEAMAAPEQSLEYFTASPRTRALLAARGAGPLAASPPGPEAAAAATAAAAIASRGASAHSAAATSAAARDANGALSAAAPPRSRSLLLHILESVFALRTLRVRKAKPQRPQRDDAGVELLRRQWRRLRNRRERLETRLSSRLSRPLLRNTLWLVCAFAVALLGWRLVLCSAVREAHLSISGVSQMYSSAVRRFCAATSLCPEEEGSLWGVALRPLHYIESSAPSRERILASLPPFTSRFRSLRETLRGVFFEPEAAERWRADLPPMQLALSPRLEPSPLSHTAPLSGLDEIEGFASPDGVAAVSASQSVSASPSDCGLAAHAPSFAPLATRPLMSLLSLGMVSPASSAPQCAPPAVRGTASGLSSATLTETAARELSMSVPSAPSSTAAAAAAATAAPPPPPQPEPPLSDSRSAPRSRQLHSRLRFSPQTPIAEVASMWLEALHEVGKAVVSRLASASWLAARVSLSAARYTLELFLGVGVFSFSPLEHELAPQEVAPPPSAVPEASGLAHTQRTRELTSFFFSTSLSPGPVAPKATPPPASPQPQPPSAAVAQVNETAATRLTRAVVGKALIFLLSEFALSTFFVLCTALGALSLAEAMLQGSPLRKHRTSPVALLLLFSLLLLALSAVPVALCMMGVAPCAWREIALESNATSPRAAQAAKEAAEPPTSAPTVFAQSLMSTHLFNTLFLAMSAAWLTRAGLESLARRAAVVARWLQSSEWLPVRLARRLVLRVAPVARTPLLLLRGALRLWLGLGRFLVRRLARAPV